ncbi:MAG: hypothetical protein ACI8QZ_003450 [Chlamydiales bacterium]|jgi:hypothetical protein
MMAPSHPGVPPSPALPRHRQRRDTPLGAPSLAVTGQGGASPRFAPEPEAEGTLSLSLSLSPASEPRPEPHAPILSLRLNLFRLSVFSQDVEHVELLAVARDAQ